jgi:hypothetical protein
MITQTFKTADAGIEQLLADGFERTDYDPVYPFMLIHNDGDGMMARVTWCDRRERYIIEGVYL